MAIKLTSETILDRTILDGYLHKFNERVEEVDVSIRKLTAEIAKASNEKQELLLKDMVTAGDEYRKPLANCVTKIENYKKMLATEEEKKNTFINIMQNPEVERLLKEFYDRSREEISMYQTVEEGAIYAELGKIRDTQLTLIDKLNSTRNSIETEVDEFSRIAKALGYNQFGLTVGYHENPMRPNPSCAEHGAMMFNCTSIKNARYLYDMSKRCY